MGFFENLGRKVGEFTQEAKETAAEEAAYACKDCGKRVHTDQEECPRCGSANVTERDTRSTADETASPENGDDTIESDEDAKSN